MIQNMKALLLLSAFAAMSAGSAQAQIVATAKCETGKVKCVVNKTAGLLKCEAKAAKLGAATDSLCLAKVRGKFTGSSKSCMEKNDAKNLLGKPCRTLGDGAAVEAKVDAFVADFKSTYYTNPPPTGPNACWWAQTKCVANYVKAILNCESKAVKTGLPTDSLCLAKAMAKLTGSATSCMEKLDAATKPCSSSGQSGQGAAVKTSTQAYVDDVRAELMPNNIFQILTQPGVGTCGSVDSTSGALLALNCGDLAVGGGQSTIPPYPVPDGSTTKFSLLGTSGATRAIGGAPSAMTGSNRNCSRAGCKFGGPVPVINGGLSTCLDNSFTAAASGTLNLTAGTLLADIPLETVVTVTGNAGQPCPICSGGMCSPDAVNAGASCTPDTNAGQSHDCVAAGPVLPAFEVDLAGTTTGSASAFDAGGIFCPGQANSGAFGTGPTGTTITETGSPGGDLTNAGTDSATLATVFCIPGTGNLLIDGSADLPGPGALSLAVTADVQ